MKELACRYAKALYSVVPDEDQLTRSVGDLQACGPLWDALTSPAVRASQKEAVLCRLPALAGNPRLLRFFCVLARRGRLALLSEIVEAFHEWSLRQQNVAEAVVTWARRPDPDELEKLRAALCRMHQKSHVRLISRLDPSLLGGFRLEIEGVTYDQSIRGRLRGLSRHLEVAGRP